MGISVLDVLIVSYIGIPFFGVCAGFALYRLILPCPALVVDNEGIIDRASALAVGFISWDEIKRIMPYTYMGQAMLGIEPKDLSTVLARQGWLKRCLIRMNLRLGCAAINIPQVILPITIDELAGRMMLHFGDDFFIDDLLKSNPAFQALLAKSKASERKPFSPGSGG
jgi:hypothetical protein